MKNDLIPSLNRRRLLASSVAALPAALAAWQVLATNTSHGGHGAHGQAQPPSSTPNAQSGQAAVAPGYIPTAEEENALLEALYQAALANGERLTVYAGGDTPTQQDYAKAGFTERFPGVDINIVVDYSKIHDVRIDNQFATDSVVPDVVQLQTLQDFERWKDMSRLLPYKPASFGAIHHDFKDPDGAWLAIGIIAFSYMGNPSAIDVPASPKELADPRFKGQIASSYPQDDDAVLYLYKLYADYYGWDWVRRMAEQDIQFARGTNTPGEAVEGGVKPIGIGGAGSLTSNTAQMRWVVESGHPFMAWGQRAAILKTARNLNAAKLYLSWLTSRAQQAQSFNGWSVRTDVQPEGGLQPIWTYDNSFWWDFPAFMRDRAEVERWRQTFVLYFGDVKGDPSPGILGLTPGA